MTAHPKILIVMSFVSFFENVDIGNVDVIEEVIGLRTMEIGGGGAASKAPEWDGESIPFQDWLIKARLWLATTKVRKKSQGPMMLQGLSGVAFHTFKHWAKDVNWLQDDQGVHRLLNAMDLPDNFGDDKEEDLFSSLAKIPTTFEERRMKSVGASSIIDSAGRRRYAVSMPAKWNCRMPAKDFY